MKNYEFILIPFITLICAQLLKFIIDGIKNDKFDINRLLNGCGGMPSSHTAFTTSLATIIAIRYGLSSVEFAISLIFATIVAYDSIGVRLQSGKQASIINKMMDTIMKGTEIYQYKRLKEQQGHTIYEVLVGLIFGIVMAVLLSLVI